MDEEPVMMKIKDIVVKMEYYPRIGLDEETVARYQELYKMGIKLPPILIQKKGLIAIDGLHRLEAQDRLGREEVAVVFEDIPESEIYITSIRINIPHGKAFSREDTKKQIRHLRFEITSSLTHEEISKAVLLSTSRVGEICREIWKEMESEFMINGSINAKVDGRRNITLEETREIQDRVDDGELQKEVAKDYPVGDSWVSQLVKKPRIPKPYKTGRGRSLSQMPRKWIRRWIEKRFRANNPRADFQEVDFDGHFSTDAESYHDLVDNFRTAYPQFEWLYPNERPLFNIQCNIPPELIFGKSIEIDAKVYFTNDEKYAQVKGTIPKEILPYVRDRFYEKFTIELPLIEPKRPDRYVFPELSDEELSDLDMSQVNPYLSDEELSELERSLANPHEPEDYEDAFHPL